MKEQSVLQSLAGLGSAYTLLLVATCLILIITLLLVNFYMNETYKYIRKIPVYKGWPIVGDVLHMKRDPVGMYMSE